MAQPQQSAQPLEPVGGGILQGKCACGGSGSLAGACVNCKKKLIQRKAATLEDESSSVPPIVHDVLRSPGEPLDAETRRFMESRFGHDFSRVRVYTDAHAAESARAVKALAYTVGSRIAFGAGQYRPGTAAGEKLLAHELAHVMQQGDQNILPDVHLELDSARSPLERDADRVADAVSRKLSFDEKPQRPVAATRGGQLLQRQDDPDAEPSSPMRVSGQDVRRSPAGGAAISNGTLSWELRFVGRSASARGTRSGGVSIIWARDVLMSVTFRPSGGAGNCPSIGFIQTVRPTIGGMPDTGSLLFTREPASGSSVDVFQHTTDPYYTAEPSSSGPGLGSAASNWRLAGTARGRSASATFSDAPSRPARHIPPGQLLVREFEVAVICVETGQTFGSIRWGYTKTHDGVITLTGAQPSDVQARAAPPQLETVRQAFYSGFFQHSLSDFALGSDALTVEHRRTLQSIAAGGRNIHRIVLVGANDFSGGPEANAALSLRRAQAVRNELVRLGINSGLIEVQGHGVAARVPNPPGQQVAANRRVDVHIERGTIPTSTGDVGSTAEGVRFVQQDPRLTFDELIALLLELQRLSGTLPQDRCNQLGFMRDSLRRWRSIDPSVPDVDALYGALIRAQLGRCPPSRLPAPASHEPSGHRPGLTGPPNALGGPS